MKARKAILVGGVLAFLGAFAPVVLILKMMADNNNNGELFDTVTGRWDVGYALQISAIAYVPSFLVIFALTACLARFWPHSKKLS